MIKKVILLAVAVMGIVGTNKAQVCGTDEQYRAMKDANPDIAKYEAAMELQIQQSLKSMDLRKFMRTTAAGDTDVWYDIPMVVHVIHDNGAEFTTDNSIFEIVKHMNDVYALRNNVSAVIPPFIPYIGKAKIRFHLANKDPEGNPTNGITRRLSYLTYGGDDFAKMDQWNPRSYFNLWFEAIVGQQTSGGVVLAYATLPPSAAANPYSDGVIGIYNATDGLPNTYAHEAGHYLSLYHPWNSSFREPEAACGDDEVDDTPPTKGHFTHGCPLYDTACATGYFKVYPSSVPGVDSLVDYPDTTNAQNVMDYSGSCTNMFTKGQVTRMRATLAGTTANRDSLWSKFNLTITGIIKNDTSKIGSYTYLPKPDLMPKAEFAVQNTSTYSKTRVTHYFLATGASNKFYFKNQSWNDTITSVSWTFPNGTPATANATAATLNTPVPVSFSTPGWANITLVARSNSGSDSITKPLVYVADPAGVDPKGYYQEFNTNSGNDLDKWPIFNYYNNEFKWQLNNSVGYYDNNCIMYTGWDPRGFPAIATGTPRGDFDDFFTRAFNLSAWSSASTNCNINFMYAGTYKTGISLNMNDTLEISYSTDGGNTWVLFDTLTKGKIASRGSLGVQFTPSWQGDWALHSHNIPLAGRGASTFFRFRYKPGTDKYGYSSGNNFYLDRINVNDQPVGITTLIPGNSGVMVMPNPTNSNAFVLVKEQNSNSAKVIVTDVTGKQVFATEQQLVDGAARIEIPASYISVKGMYMVQVISGGQSHTDKLVVY